MCVHGIPTRRAHTGRRIVLWRASLICTLFSLLATGSASGQYPGTLYSSGPYPGTPDPFPALPVEQHCRVIQQTWKPIPTPPETPATFVARHLLSVVLSEEFANTFVETESSEDGPVRENILGADVVGTQTTRSRAQLDFVPNAEQAKMYVHLRGTTNNTVSSWTPQAVIRSQGEYRFQLSKQVDWKGLKVSTRSPAAYIEPQLLNLHANTPGDQIPLIGPIAGMIAYQTAEQQKPLAERIAAQRVTRQVSPKFNDTVDAQLASLNQQLESLSTNLSGHLAPLGRGVASETSDQEFRLGLGESGGELNSPLILPGAPLVVVVHEELVNLLMRNLPIAGLSVSDAEVDRALDLFRRDPQVIWKGTTETIPPLPPTFARMKFADRQPIQVRFLNDLIEVRTRMTFTPLLGPAVPLQEIVMEYLPRLTKDGLRVDARLAEIVPADPIQSPPLPDLIMAVLKQQVTQRLQPLTTPPRLPIPHTGQGPQELRLVDIRVQNGFLVLGYEGVN